jgi:hypothetical protein
MKLPTVVARVSERFVRPLQLDQIRALIRPAIQEVRRGEPGPHVAELEAQINDFARTPTGTGLRVPEWIESLEREVERVEGGELSATAAEQAAAEVPRVRLSHREILAQFDSAS